MQHSAALALGQVSEIRWRYPQISHTPLNGDSLLSKAMAMTWQDELAANRGVVQRCDVPSTTLRRLAAAGSLVRLFPGTYVAPNPDLLTIHEAMTRWDQDAILLGAAAARLSFWPQCPMRKVEISTLRRPQPATHHPDIRLTVRRIPEDLVVLQLTSPALTAIDLVDSVGIVGICHALRTGAATSDQLRRALAATAGRPGHKTRRSALLAAESEPWSPLEADLHKILRKHQITGWKANQPIRVGGERYFGDVVFHAQRVIIEVDGWEYHSTHQAFVNDRRRQAALSLDGWLILRFTHMDLADPDYVIACIRKALVWRKAA